MSGLGLASLYFTVRSFSEVKFDPLHPTVRVSDVWRCISLTQ
jgi:hypothetical protein